jgi:hypothetical protein
MTLVWRSPVEAMTVRSFRQMQAALTPRHNHPLQPRLGIIAAPAIVEDRDAEAAAAIAMRTPQPKLQIKDKRMEP